MKKDKKMNKNKTMKWAARALALCLVGTMAFAGAGMLAPVTAEAAPVIEQTPTSGNLTVSKKDDKGHALSGATFAVYKVMSLTPGEEPGDYASYTVETAFSSVLSGVTPDALGNYSAAELEEKIQDLKSVVDRGNATAAQTQTTATGTGNAVFSDLPLGYYLVVETSAPDGYVTGSPFLIAIPSTNNYNSTSTAGTSWIYDVTAEPKNTSVSIDKELADPETGAEQDGSVAVGDYVKYEITTTIPDYPEEYTEPTFTINDVLSDGLTIQNDPATGEHPVTVTVNGETVTAGADTYTLTANEAGGNNPDLTVAFTSDYIEQHGDESVVVTYYAQVNENAVAGPDGNSNGASVTYNNNPSTTTTAKAEPVKVYSFEIQVVKFTNEDGTKPLEGAEFELWNENMSEKLVNALTTNVNGQITFELLDEGTYYLKETKSPAGYTLLADPIKVEITATKENGHATGAFTLRINGEAISTSEETYVSHMVPSTGTAVVAVENHKGFSLPSTGGSGIALFLIIGAAGIITLSVVITKKTKKNS